MLVWRQLYCSSTILGALSGCDCEISVKISSFFPHVGTHTYTTLAPLPALYREAEAADAEADGQAGPGTVR